MVALVKHLYAECLTWQVIMKRVCEQFPMYASDLSERRLVSIYESNKDDFKLARKERVKSSSAQFNEDREALFNTTLSAEVKMATSLQSEINRVSDALKTLDPVEDFKPYSTLTRTLKDMQVQLEKLSGTDTFRKLEINKRLLEQRKEILGIENKDGDDEKQASVTVIGPNDPLLD